MTIGVLVYADDRTEAKMHAENIMDTRLCKDQNPFDYYTVKHVRNMVSKVAQKNVQTLHGWTRAAFERNMQTVRSAISSGRSNEELFEDGNRDMFKYAAYKLGEYDGSDIHLYDNDGEGIRDSNHLHQAINKWPCLEGRYPKPEGDVWLVECDVHY